MAPLSYRTAPHPEWKISDSRPLSQKDTPVENDLKSAVRSSLRIPPVDYEEYRPTMHSLIGQSGHLRSLQQN